MRFEPNAAYWDRRWASSSGDRDRFDDLSIYPIKYSEMVMGDPSARAVELGAGLGRLLKHYRRLGHDIVGIERSAVAVARLRQEDPTLDVREGDVLDLPFASGEFDVTLAFGLYHNLERGLDQALAETARILRPGGSFCISMRPDNLEMQLNEWYWRRHNGRPRPGVKPAFHKWLIRADEFAEMLMRHGLRTRQTLRARNVSLLYRIPILRERTVDEGERRSRGYRLNAAGRALDRILVRIWPDEFCNVLVFVGERTP